MTHQHYPTFAMHTGLASIWQGVMALIVLLAALAGRMPGEETGMSLNSEITVVPAPGTVTIDGDSADWDLSAGVWSYNSPTIVAKFGVWTHLMWDAKGVYFLARFADRTPLRNPTMGKDFGMSWKDDCYQARVIFDDGTPDEHQMHVNMFYSAPEKRPYMIVKHGGFMDKAPFDETGPNRPDQEQKWGPTMDKAGGTIALKAWANGKGYTCEAFWPWSYCRTSGQPLKPGERFTFGIEALWSNSRLADGILNDKVNRIFMFRARKGWGQAVISATGSLAKTAEQESIHAARLKAFTDYGTYGSIPIAYTVAKAPGPRDVTVAIDDASGKRVRNLIGQHPRTVGANQELWDGLDDDGKPVTPGSYAVTIVDHDPVEVRLVNSLYNAGTPPWPTESGRKLWGSNHGHPTTVATRKGDLVVGFTGNEGATGLLRADPDGIIQWTDSGEVADAALDERFVYELSPDSWISLTVVRRFDRETGRNVPFEDASKSVHIVMPVNGISPASTLAVSGGTVFVLLIGPQNRRLVRMDAASGAIISETDGSALVAIKNRDETVYALQTDGAVVVLGDDGKPGKPLFTASGLGNPARIGVSHDAKRFAISDTKTNQVFVFAAAGKRLAVIGKPYEAALRPAGAFVDTDLIRPLGLDFDAQGRLWIAEAEKSSRRVTRWISGDAASYALDRQFWGGADYGAMSGFAITFDATRFIAHGVEFALDPQADPVTRPTQEKPLIFHPALSQDQRGFVYRVNKHEYAVTTPGFNGPHGFMIAKRDPAGVFVPCVQVRFGGKAWVDRNDNGQEDAGEVHERFTDMAAYWSSGWTRPDLTIITTSQHIYRATAFSPGGVPLYDFAKPEKPANTVALTPHEQGSTGTVIMNAAGDISDGISYHTVAGKQGRYPNRYGRHDAPAAQRGVLIAPFRTNGVIEDVPGVGSVTALGGDRGEWFLLSMDGIYLSSILQDSKGDITMDETFVGQESFGGFFWRDEKGRVLAQLGGASYRIVEIAGLETTRKQALTVSATAQQIEQGQAIAKARAAGTASEPKELTIAALATLPSEPVSADQERTTPLIAGVSDTVVTMPGDPSRTYRVALAHDGKDLAVMWQVADASPWKNGSNRFTHAFIGGDCVDLKLDVPGRGPLRVLVAPLEGKDSVVYAQAKAAAKDGPVTYMVGNNPANATNLDVVKRMASATATSKVGGSGYSVLLRVPLADLGIDPAKAPALSGVIGVIYSDPLGTNRVARMYWCDKATDLVSDVPSEARLDPARWGKLVFSPAK
ncbi:MAG: hypothetical protein H0W72_04220 [Planctomycetes bacterium]|nr:hypothetical protein [Planctomycetota bacterium]